MKNKKLVFLMVIALSIIFLVGCTKENKENQNFASETNQDKQVKDQLDEVDNTDKTDLPGSTDEIKESESTQKGNSTNTVTKIEGRKSEFLEKLDNIQKELDALPEKKDSDAGVTNAMKNYYGKSYEMYDEALNEIYALLKEELPLEIMKDLKTKQIKWIKQKEVEADKEESEYEGGTFQFVARYISLYESTKGKCYELVNEYMAD